MGRFRFLPLLKTTLIETTNRGLVAYQTEAKQSGFGLEKEEGADGYGAFAPGGSGLESASSDVAAVSPIG